MLSQNPTTIQQRQQRHRRQQSTPNVFDPAKVQPIQRQASHRRGTSLDQRQRRQSPTQEYMVSNTNQGFQQQNQQHILRETQQQRLVRPGQQQQQYLTYDNDENFFTSPLVTPIRQEFDAGCMNSYDGSRQAPSQYYSGPVNSTIKVDPYLYNQFGPNDSPLFPDGSTTPSAYLDFSAGFEEMSGQQDWGATVKPMKRQNSGRRISGGIAGRVAQFEGMGGQNPASRPITPPTQQNQDYFPPTPATTPFNRAQQSQPLLQRFQEGYDTSMEETIKPGRNKSRARNVFQEMREQAESNRPPSPPGTVAMLSTAKFDTARMPTSSSKSNLNINANSNVDFMQNGCQATYYSPSNSNLSPEMSQQSSPEMSHSELLSGPFDNAPNMAPHNHYSHGIPMSRSSTDMSQQMSPIHIEQSRRSESVDSLNLEETITETGISIDDIAAYIQGPDADQKWVCLFDNCGKRFGRKENIKSHVQTHLGDRQYQCPHCKKCFVRQHDLKRHAKIHSGVKPYPCLCGNSFARHDALTRHRQRGMCIGAFEGVVKKVVKRGRPRKNRPDNESRIDKASRTRSKNKDRGTGSQPSSASEYSESSYGPSPPADYDDVLDSQPFEFTQSSDFSQASSLLDATTSSFHQYSQAGSPMSMNNNNNNSYVSPAAMISAASPSAYSVHSQHSQHSSQQTHTHYRNNSIVSLADSQLPALPPSPTKTIHSAYSPPPELSLSSSSPAASSSKYADFSLSLNSSTNNNNSNNHNQSEDIDLSKLADLQMDNSVSGMNVSVGAVGDDTDMFLEQFGAGEDSLMMMDGLPDTSSKFEDAFLSNLSGLDGNGGVHGLGFADEGGFVDDVFFGSP